MQLYARARAAQLDGDRVKSISLLRSAVELDKDSFALNYALGMAYLGAGVSNESVIARFEKAASLEPDHLDVQLQLGRQYLVKADYDKSIEHLRLALQTAEYATRSESAALVNLFLAEALQQKGYDFAALEQYGILLRRMQGRLSLRGNPELYFLISRPERVYMQVGELNEKYGRYADALQSYRLATEREPNNLDYQSHVVNALLGLKKNDEAGAGRRSGERPPRQP